MAPGAVGAVRSRGSIVSCATPPAATYRGPPAAGRSGIWAGRRRRLRLRQLVTSACSSPTTMVVLDTRSSVIWPDEPPGPVQSTTQYEVAEMG